MYIYMQTDLSEMILDIVSETTQVPRFVFFLLLGIYVIQVRKKF